MKKILMTGVMIASVTASGLAFADTPKLHTETKLLGYNVTTEVPSKSVVFARMDRDNNNVVTFKEFQRQAQLENEYEIFARMDMNQDKAVDIAEYSSFEKTKGVPVTESDGENRVAVEDGRDPAVYTQRYFVPSKTYNFKSRTRLYR